MKREKLVLTPSEEVKSKQSTSKQKPPYKPPQMSSYRDDELLKLLGPAQAGSVNGNDVMGWLGLRVI